MNLVWGVKSYWSGATTGSRIFHYFRYPGSRAFCGIFQACRIAIAYVRTVIRVYGYWGMIPIMINCFCSPNAGGICSISKLFTVIFATIAYVKMIVWVCSYCIILACRSSVINFAGDPSAGSICSIFNAIAIVTILFSAQKKVAFSDLCQPLKF